MHPPPNAFASARALDGAIEKIAREAAEAWPRVKLAHDVFVAHLRERLGDDPAKALERLQAADLFLACACMHGDRQAWRELDRLHLARVGEWVGRIDRAPAFADEVRQRLAEKLLRDDSGKPKLALYTGRGPLGAWLRVAAVREAQNTRRGTKQGVDADELPLASPDEDPEIKLFKRKYSREFKEAFAGVLATLSSDERNVLRLHYLDGMTIEEVGKSYRVSRATAARWIADAKEKITRAVNVSLEKKLGRSGPGANTILAFVRSQLDMSLRRHFS
ncbi:MAG TPA: sigma-70 family RNA polymerase sigma factor [Labilithrix sp.]